MNVPNSEVNPSISTHYNQTPEEPKINIFAPKKIKIPQVNESNITQIALINMIYVPEYFTRPKAINMV